MVFECLPASVVLLQQDWRRPQKLLQAAIIRDALSAGSGFCQRRQALCALLSYLSLPLSFRACPPPVSAPIDCPSNGIIISLIAISCNAFRQDYLLFYNYWKTNLKDNTIVFPNEGNGGNGGYFG